MHAIKSDKHIFYMDTIYIIILYIIHSCNTAHNSIHIAYTKIQYSYLVLSVSVPVVMFFLIPQTTFKYAVSITLSFRSSLSYLSQLICKFVY